MYEVYFLRSIKDRKLYIGYSKNLKARIAQHIAGHVDSTKYRRPLKLIGWRCFTDLYEAIKWEKKYKNSHGQFERDLKNGKITICRTESKGFRSAA